MLFYRVVLFYGFFMEFFLMGEKRKIYKKKVENIILQGKRSISEIWTKNVK